MVAQMFFRLLSIGTVLTLALGASSQCSEPMDQGTGDDRTLQFFYDGSMDTCRPFFYNGQQGNENRFMSDRECMEACSSRFDQLYPAAEAVCDMPVDHGSCMAMVLMYYYNHEESNCRVFHYGGCQGNGNRFESREECQRTCMARAGRFGGPGQNAAPNPDESTTSAGLVVAIIGGIIFTLAVVAAIVYFVKQRKQRATSDMEMN